MARFPRRESDALPLLHAMVEGCDANQTVLPNAHLAGLRAARNAYKDARFGEVCLVAAAKLATDEKDVKLDALTELIRVQFEQSEVDVAAKPDALRLIGWGPEAPAQASRPPGQPRALEAVDQGSGTLVLDWKPPAAGAAAPVRTYVVERREQPEGPWSIAGVEGTNAVRHVSEATEAHLTNQPRSQQVEYRVRAHDLVGASPPSDGAPCVL